MKNTTLSEFESCVLAVIWRDGPMTAYEVRTVFRKSITANWRASTGSIYPMVRKLEKLDCISVEDVPGSKRGARLLSVTSAGKIKLRAWLEVSAEEIADPVADPIRTRFYFLNFADSRTKKKLLKQWIVETEKNIKTAQVCLTEWKEAGRKLAAAAQKGALMQLQARKEWLVDFLENES